MTDRDDPRPGVSPWSGTAPRGGGLEPTSGVTAPRGPAAPGAGPIPPPGPMHPRHHQQHSPPPSPPYGGGYGQAPRGGPPPGYGGYGGGPQAGYGAPPPGYRGPPPGGAYGPPPGYGAPPPGFAPAPPGGPVSHRPGPGAVVALAGWVLLAASFFALPFLDAPEGLGDDPTFMDMRDAVTAEVPDTGTTLDPGLTPSDPSLDPSLTPSDPSGVEPPAGFDAQGLRGQVPAPSSGGGSTGQVPVTPEVTTDSGAEFVETYVDYLWVAVLVWVGMGVVFATLLVPRSQGGRVACGFFGAGLVGLVANMADARGTYGPRVTGVVGVLVGGAVHGYALSEILGGDLAPDPGLGAYAGGLGIVLALVGVLIGTRTEPARY